MDDPLIRIWKIYVHGLIETLIDGWTNRWIKRSLNQCPSSATAGYKNNFVGVLCSFTVCFRFSIWNPKLSVGSYRKSEKSGPYMNFFRPQIQNINNRNWFIVIFVFTEMNATNYGWGGPPFFTHSIRGRV